MTAYDKRAAIMQLADEMNKQRLTLLETIREINKGITVLVQAADDLLPMAVEERNPDGTEVRKITYNKRPAPEDIVNFTAPSRRHCSNCGEPGHTARTCTNVRKLKHGDVPTEVAAEVMERVVKKTRKPMSPERKAKAIEALKKARAARGKK